MADKLCIRCNLRKDLTLFNQCLEHKDKHSHWCSGCDRRKGPHLGQPSGELPTNLPGRETACLTCRTELRFDTDRDGRLTQSCQCGQRFVHLRTATKDGAFTPYVLSLQSVTSLAAPGFCVEE